MKKLYLTGALCLFLTACSNLNEPSLESNNNLPTESHFVSISKALKNADNQFATMFKGTRSTKTIKSTETLGLKTRSSESDSLYGFYIVNYDEGFALLSADDRRPSVIALSEEGSLHASDTVSNKSLALYLNVIENAEASQFNPDLPVPNDSITYIEPSDPLDSVLTETRYLYKSVAPKLDGLAKTIHQGAPFNLYCLTLMGEKAMAGCVPVSITSYCSYYKYPTEYLGYTLRWSKNIFEWARFLEIVGRRNYCNVSYGVNYTDCSVDNLCSTFEQLGYDASDYEEWNSGLAPLYAVGFTNTTLVICGGYNENHLHTWIVDGGKIMRVHQIGDDASNDTYEYYLHCVWGEKGNANGYFLYVEDKCGGTPKYRDDNTSGRMPIFTNLIAFPPMIPNNN